VPPRIPAEEAARAYDAAARAIRGPTARTNFAFDPSQPQPVRTRPVCVFVCLWLLLLLWWWWGAACPSACLRARVRMLTWAPPPRVLVRVFARACAPPRPLQTIEFPTQPGQACVVHLPPLPGKPTPAAAPAGPAGTSRQQQLHHNQQSQAQQHARGAAPHRAPGAMPPPSDGASGGPDDPRAAPHAPSGAGIGGAIAIPTRPGGGDVFAGTARGGGIGGPGGGPGGGAGRPGGTTAAVAGVGGAFSFKSSYGSLMDATGMNVYLDGGAGGALGGALGSPMMTAFAVPSSSLGQAASFPRSLGPVGDVLGDMDVGSPAAWDGGAG
jgi:hypothetical protein